MGSSSSTSSFSLRILLISIGILTAATAVNFFLPAILNFIISDIPVIWSVILSWLKPPYLYVVINGIIITIAATSRFHQHFNHHNHDNQSTSLPPPDLTIHPTYDELEDSPVVFVGEFTETEVPPVVYELPEVDIETVPFNDSQSVVTDSVDKFVVTRSTWNSPAEIIQSELISPVTEKPLVKSRFANQRRTTKSITEGVKSLKVAKPKRHETLETTWKTITDGRHMPLTRHLRKSDTFENNHHHAPSSGVDSGEQLLPEHDVMKKSETFNDLNDHKNHRVLARLRKQGSPSQDELNRRVEAFIKKFNEEMRLQRQESLNRYREMINRGAE